MDKPFNFRIIKENSSGPRTGVIQTPHGEILTPAFVPVGTQGSIKSLTSDEITELGVQLFFVNTYHILLRPGIKVIKKFGGLHQFMNWSRPLMTDSGGFQVFSLSQRKFALTKTERSPSLVKIDENGVNFRSHWDGKMYRLTPENSIKLQHELGADILIAFDDCTPYPVRLETAQKSLERTHRWAIESLSTHKSLLKNSKQKQMLFGSIQGSVYRALREKSAKFISSLPFDGYAIGGMAVGESKIQMKNVLKWVTPLLPFGKPRHLLGVGEIDDIFTLTSFGIDTFDCVMPTRLGRMGHLLIKIKDQRSKIKTNRSSWKMNITKSIYAMDKRPIEPDCHCYTCCNYSRAYLHHLFKVKELLAYRLATIHNLYFIEELMKKIRNSIKEDRLDKVKKEYLG